MELLFLIVVILLAVVFVLRNYGSEMFHGSVIAATGIIIIGGVLAYDPGIINVFVVQEPPCIDCLTFDATNLYNSSINCDYIFINGFPEHYRAYKVTNGTLQIRPEKETENLTEISREVNHLNNVNLDFTVVYLGDNHEA